MSNVNWFKEAIIYQIFIDRFAGFNKNNWEKPEFIGGNLKGIIKKLPYLKELGVNTLWISPFYKTSAYHGYHITDYFKIDPHFGSLQDLKNLIKKVHKNNMHIIADFVPNHCSYKHPYFLEAQKNKKSKYFHWFFFNRWPNDYMCFLSFKELPKINLDHPPARDYIVKSAKYWLSLGLDGYRLDHIIGPSHKFWKYFRRKIKKEFPSVILIGEAWMKGIKLKELKTLNVKRKFWKWLFNPSSDSLLRSYVKELDGVLDFEFEQWIKHFFHKKRFFKSDWLLKLILKLHYAKFPKNYFLPTFLDNHDMNRFLFECHNDTKKLKRAAKIQFSLPQPPIIYYGTEIGMTHSRAIEDFKEYGDLQVRKPMEWDHPDNDLLEFYKNLIKDRKKVKLK